MGLKGNLATVSLADVFQALSHGHSTGLLRIQTPEGTRFVEIQDGAVTIVSGAGNRILIGDLLIARGLLNQDQLQEALKRQKESGNLLGQVMVELGLVTMDDLEAALRFQVEEEICDLFLLKEAEFDFLANASLDAKMALGGGFLRLKIDPNSLLLEAARRVDEWKELEKRVRSQASLWRLTDSGREMLTNSHGLSPEGLVLLQLTDEQRTVESMVQKACLGRMNTNLLLVELWDAELIQPLPPTEYLDAAKAHHEAGRLDEAERIARCALELEGDAGRKEALQKLLKDLERKRNLVSGATASADSVRVRSEVIRRPNPALIIQKKGSGKTLAIASVFLVILAGGGGWTYYKHFRQAEIPDDVRRQFDAWMLRVDEAIAKRAYDEAFDLLQVVPRDEAIRKKSAEKYSEVLKIIGDELTQCLNHTKLALDAGDPKALDDAANELKRFTNLLPKLEGPVRDEFAVVQKRFDEWRQAKAAKAFRGRLAEAEKLEGDARAEAMRAMLAEGPPEEIACKLRAQVSTLDQNRAAAQAVLELGKRDETLGDLTSARLRYQTVISGHPGSAQAQEAQQRQTALDEHLKTVGQTLEKVNRLMVQRDFKTAQQELEAFFKLDPDIYLAKRARELLSTVNASIAPEAEAPAENMWKEIQRLELRGQLDEAMKKKSELVDTHPLSQAASKATLRLKITSQPAGAKITLNGVLTAQPTPTELIVPMQGLVRVDLQKDGFEAYTYAAKNLRESSIDVVLNRLPAQAPRLLPGAVTGSLSRREHWLVWLQGPDVWLLNGKLKPEEPLLKVTPEASAEALRHIRFVQGSDLEALVCGSAASNRIYRIDPTTLRSRVLELKSPALAAPVSLAHRLMPNRPFLGVTTEAGFECFNLVDGGARFAAKTLPGGAPPTGCVLDHDDLHFYFARGDGKLYAIAHESGEERQASLPPEPFGGPAVHADSKSVVILAREGTLQGWSTATLQQTFTHKLGAAPRFGPLSLKNGFLAVTGAQTLELAAPDRAQTLWTTNLDAEPVLPPVAVGTDYIAIATASHLVLKEAATGHTLWTARLPQKPTTLLGSGDQALLVTEDGYLRVYDGK